MELELFKSITKYPFIYKEEFFNSYELEQNNTCLKKCKEKDCLKLFRKDETMSEYVCSKGFDSFLLIVGEHKYLINGLILDTNKIISKERKDARKDWIIHKNSLLLFSRKIAEIQKNLIKRENEGSEKNFSIFHDFKTSMSIFFNCTQDIVNKLPGNTFEEKLDNSDKVYKDLYNSLELITSQLGMIDVIINPKSISFGIKKEINIYKLFNKVQILFGHLSTKKRNVNIELISVDGTYIQNSLCFESIEFIPLILLDNALKYSSPDSVITIEIRQLYRKAKITVKNIGPFVSDENTEKIFDKFFRDESAINFSKEGIGMGLWIAQQILSAHQTRLFYYKDTKEFRPIGLNILEFELPTY